ncbi:hypothetical protein CHS0354_036402 [Potamilus streckersoni]|uniref:Uncharacterized protein n=1 Tax=Potamilus streckersoni TaxID=2493646 RepID=A0AAE0SW93_9BIVA|nr:hypothetical protein CHS0354_036402 [Potamilus streckersoni]
MPILKCIHSTMAEDRLDPVIKQIERRRYEITACGWKYLNRGEMRNHISKSIFCGKPRLQALCLERLVTDVRLTDLQTGLREIKAYGVSLLVVFNID